MNPPKLYLLLLLIVLLFCFGSAFAQDNVVVPGQRVGSVRLGDTRAATTKALGKPSETKRWRSGLVKDAWLGPAKPADSTEEQISFNVIYRAKRVIQIEFNDPKFQTKEGVSIESTLAHFRAHHRHPRVRAYAYVDDGSGFVGYYYDDVRGGIAFSFGTQDYFDETTIPEALRVHAAGIAVIPDPGGKPTRANDERPVQKNPAAASAHHSNARADDGQLQTVIEEFWDGLGRLDGERLKSNIAWPITIVEADESGNRQTVLHNPAELDAELTRGTPAGEKPKTKSEFFGTKLSAFQVQMLNANLASVSYLCRLPHDNVAANASRAGTFKALTILRREPNAAAGWKIIFITVPK